MNALESWLVNLTGETYLWIGELFLIVFAALLAGYLLNKLFISSMSSLESIGPGARTFENLIIPLFCKKS